MSRKLSLLDNALAAAQHGLRTALDTHPPGQRATPGEDEPDAALDNKQRKHAAGLMRVNHAGEVAAQALYRGQAAVAQNPNTKSHLLEAAEEEQDHLAWCAQRLRELDAAPSKLGPAWYAGSYAIGALAGLAGDRYSLGFVAETERQVEQHLRGHLDDPEHGLPAADARSRAIAAQMQADEAEHGQAATAAGGQPLPAPVRSLMRGVAKVMTGGAYWL